MYSIKIIIKESLLLFLAAIFYHGVMPFQLQAQRFNKERSRNKIIMKLEQVTLDTEVMEDRHHYHHNRHSPWYSHPHIDRDRTHVQMRYNELSDIINRYQEELQQKAEESNCNGDDGTTPTVVDITNRSKFIVISSEGMLHQTSISQSSTSAAVVASPLYLSITQLLDVLPYTKTSSSSTTSSCIDQEPISTQEEILVAYIGKYQDIDYWVVNMEDDCGAIASSTMVLDERKMILCKPLREFGDSLESQHDAGILATANGLVEFHKSHRYCSHCGSPSKPAKAGGSRICVNNGCRKSVYPRIDSATIMLVTSPCDSYVLLGRKKSWPAGRYSTLAGFCEVGETLEECCRRETFEESGVVVDPASVRFEASQPWPFPRSLMVGFRAKAMLTVTSECSGEESMSSSPSSSLQPLPKIIVDTNEMEDCRWFAKEFVKERLSWGGSTALTFEPNDAEAEFHIPGKASLARYLIRKWAHENV